ncbi:co-chaperone YbbN [Nesterenkonia sp. HG001]|uniref:co-chaperone YbbN n=1 Tax=Nesterenkonia sp. HG001 TaxID=2983207 RepID=UPI002AC5B3C6|nr:tetratricopeptide repeat protein [Nesterenkonia sp. HG001]MDZ5078625.1 tetratricopeptide repeat protein [Nesterenkonia sp. HG001]
MTQSGPESETGATASVNARGAVDLSQLGGAGGPDPQPGQPGGEHAAGADSWVVPIRPEQLQQIVQLSAQAPVIVLIHGEDEASTTMRSTLADHVDAQQGRVLLAEVDASISPELAQAQGADQIPVATAFVGGRPVGEFDSSVPADQLGQVVTEMVQLATQNGMTQKLPPQSRRARAAEEEPELPPLHQKAHDCLETGDLDGAIDAYEQALRENPGDTDASIGLAQVRLMRRTQDVDLHQARSAAAQSPDDVGAQITVADLDVLGGHVEDAFARLITFIRGHFGEERERARAHLVELYSIVGDTDPRVNTSRQQLARALF